MPWSHYKPTTPKERHGALLRLTIERRRATDQDIAAHAALYETQKEDKRAPRTDYLERWLRIPSEALAGEARSGVIFTQLPVCLEAEPDSAREVAAA